MESSAICLDFVHFADPAVPLELVTDASGFELGSMFLTWVDRAVCPEAVYIRKLSDAE